MQSTVCRILTVLEVLFLASFHAIADEAPIYVTTVEGSEYVGILEEWNADGLKLLVENESISVATEKLLSIRSQTDQTLTEPADAIVGFVDGTLIPFTEYLVSNHQASVSTPLADRPITIPTDSVRFVEFTSHKKQLAALRKRLEEAQPEGDVLVIHKKAGTALDHLSGVLGDVSSTQANFSWEGDVIPVKRSKIAALVYYHAREPELPEAICWLHTHSGAQIPLAAITFDEGKLQLTTTGNLELQLPLSSLKDADYSIGKLTYLSDLEPIREKWTPRIELPISEELIVGHGTARRDQSFTGSTLTLKWPRTSGDSQRTSRTSDEVRTYQKGLALRSRTELIYRLPSKMDRFSALAGIDPLTASQGNVQLEFSSGDKILWQGEIDGKQPPVEIQFDLEGVRQLRILVDYGENLQFGDRLHLVEAQVTK